MPVPRSAPPPAAAPRPALRPVVDCHRSVPVRAAVLVAAAVGAVVLAVLATTAGADPAGGLTTFRTPTVPMLTPPAQSGRPVPPVAPTAIVPTPADAP